MAAKKPTPASDQEPDVLSQNAQLIERLTAYYGALLTTVRERGVDNGYGDPLRPTGGILSLYMIIERKMDRARNQLYRAILDGRPINPGIADTLKDLVNYLGFLVLALEDEVPVS